MTLHRYAIRFARIGMLATVALLCGCPNGTVTIVISTPASPDDADYTLLSAQITSGPAVIPEGTSAEYVVTYTFERHRQGGAVAPFIVAVDDDGGLRFGDDELTKAQSIFGGLNDPPGRYSATGRFRLRCENDEIKGALAGSGEGHEDIFGVNEAEVYARVQRGEDNPAQFVKSAPIDVACH
jgi:hypothetical protein